MGRVGVSKCRQLERDQEAEGPAGPLCEPGLGSSWPGPLLLPLCLGCRERRGSLAAWGGVSAWSSQVVQCELPDTEYRTKSSEACGFGNGVSALVGVRCACCALNGHSNGLWPHLQSASQERGSWGAGLGAL